MELTIIPIDLQILSFRSPVRLDFVEKIAEPSVCSKRWEKASWELNQLLEEYSMYPRRLNTEDLDNVCQWIHFAWNEMGVSEFFNTIPDHLTSVEKS